MEQSPYWEDNSNSAKQIPHLMKPEGSLAYSQELATCAYAEPDESNTHLATLFT
jgi:hypothetical protein